MPVATSSRRRRNVVEDIEDPDLSQARADHVDEEEAPAPRRSKGAKKEKKPPVEPEEDPDADAEEEEDDPLAGFTDQPLDRQQAARITGLAQDWEQIRTGIHRPSYAMTRDIASSIAEFTEGEKQEKNLAEVDKLMRSLIDTENELISHEQALHELHEQVARGDAVADVISRYEEIVQQKIAEYEEKTSRKKYAKHEDYSSFRQAIYEIQQPGEAMPPVSDLIPAEEGDDSDDEDIQVGGVTQDYKCPLTLSLLTDPLTSTVCGHSYAATAIREFLNNSNIARQKCPAAGCNKVISLNDLKPNKELAKKAKDVARRERMREEESDDDDDDVIE